MIRSMVTLWMLLAVLAMPLVSKTAVAAPTEAEVTETYRLKVLGYAPPGQAFVAVYYHPRGDGRSPGLQSPPRGGGGSGPVPSTMIVLCGSMTLQDFPADERWMWDVRKVLGSGERECKGNGSVYTRTITIPQDQSRRFSFLRVAKHELELFVEDSERQREEDYKVRSGKTHTAYYDFRIGAGRVGKAPTLADRRFEVDFSLDLRGRAPRDLVVQGVIGATTHASWNVLCAGPGYERKEEMGEPGRRCKGRLEIDRGWSMMTYPPGSSFTYAFVRGDAEPDFDHTRPDMLFSCDEMTRVLVCGSVTLDSDTSVRAWYDFDKGRGGSKVIRHPYKMPSAGGGGMASEPPLWRAALVGSTLALALAAVLYYWYRLIMHARHKVRRD
ncbi:MAG: hypothetical protein M3P51_07230 [Chloroflexota bacterium]|nr:hypothetical protein [Chloroflexota bacterium]